MATVLLVSPDLNARVRLEATGAAVVPVRPEALAERLGAGPVDALVIDLDVAAEVLDLLPGLRDAEALPAVVVAYFSHVRTDLAELAAAAGVEAVARGHFWRDPAAHLHL